jgi:hypothetical protein
MNQLFIAVVLVNFLIAMVTQQYEKVMQQRVKNVFGHKCELNSEKFLLHYLTHPEGQVKFNSLIIISQTDSLKEDDDDEMNGFVDSVKNILVSYFQTIQDRLAINSKKTVKRQTEIQHKLDNQQQDLISMESSFQDLK